MINASVIFYIFHKQDPIYMYRPRVSSKSSRATKFWDGWALAKPSENWPSSTIALAPPLSKVSLPTDPLVVMIHCDPNGTLILPLI